MSANTATSDVMLCLALVSLAAKDIGNCLDKIQCWDARDQKKP